MFSRPTLGVNTAVYGDIPFTQAVAQIKQLNVDGVVITVQSTSVDYQQIVSSSELKLFGVACPAYQISELEGQWAHVWETAVKLQSPTIILPLPTHVHPFSDEAGTHFVALCRRFAQQSAAEGMQLVIELTNRYRSNLINNFSQASQFLAQVNEPNVKLSVSTFDMNIEEQDGAGLLRSMEDNLAFLRMADSNHGAIGEGHIKLGAYLWAIQDMTKDVPILLDVKRPFASPFSSVSDKSIQDALQQSRSWF